MIDTALILLSFIAGLAIARRCLAVPRSPEPRVPCYLDSAAGFRAVGAVSRLFEPKDQRYLALAEAGVGLRARFRRQRRYAMRLFLRQTRQEFRAIMREASEAAKHETVEYGAALTKLSLRFNRLYFGLWLQAQLSSLLFRPIPLARLDELAGLARVIQAQPALLSHKAQA